ncbi:MAG: DUF4190 domain-containing protein [Thermoanaerobaculia bacterium]|nr:DUF4190 domain-containing protein [Thermoanaerobaculia bacterium]
MSEPVAPAAPAKSNTPILSLVLGILSILCCGLLGPVAWYMGSQELKKIAAGTASAEGEGLSKAGMILGIIGTVLLVLSLLWIFFAGGMAVLQSMH